MRRTTVAAAVASILGSFALAGCATGRVSSSEWADVQIPEAARAESAQQIVVTIRDRPATLSLSSGATAALPLGGPGYRGSGFAQRIARQLGDEYGLKHVAAWYIDALAVHCVVFRADSVQARDPILERLRRDPRVESAQPMQQFNTSSAPPTTYNDPYHGLQRAFDAIAAPSAHRIASGRGVRIAIIDTGVDDQHPDLAGRVEAALDLVGGDPALFRRDRHGTAVAGAIAAVANNGVGIVGVAPQVRLIALRACWEIGALGAASCNSLTLAAGLAAAIERRVQVINLSLTGPADPLLERLVARALTQGIVVVGANPGGVGIDGTGGVDRNTLPFPVRVAGVVAVADSDVQREDRRDAAATRAQARPLAAPGREVFTLVPGGHYDYVSGTSMSVALVSGVVALLLEAPRGSHGSRRGPDALGSLLLRTAQPLREFSLVDAGAALAARGQPALPILKTSTAQQ